MHKRKGRNLVKQYKRYLRKLRYLLLHDGGSEKIQWLRKRLSRLKASILSIISNYKLQNRRVLTTAFVAASVSVGIQAQEFQLKLNGANPFYEVVNAGYSKPHFVDFDGDGDEDLFLTGSVAYVSDGIRDNGLIYFENTSGSYVESNSISFPKDLGIGELLQQDVEEIRLAMDFVDFDGDGDIDAFVNSYEGLGIAYLENVEGVFTVNEEDNPFKEVKVLVDENGETDLGEVELGDLDGDDIFEAIVVNNDSISVYNLEEGQFVEGQFVGSGFEMSTTLFDIDEDGDLDLMVGNKYGTIDIYENTDGVLAALEEHALTSLLLETNPAPGVTDINGDGELDIIFGMDSGSLLYFEKKEDAYKYVPYNPRGVHFFGAPSPIPEFADLDGDGDEDLLVGTFGSLTRFIENTDNNFYRNPEANPFRAASGLALLQVDPNCGDIDNDGDIDCHFLDVFDGAEQYFENIDGLFMLADSLDNPIVEFTSSENKQVVFEDFDDDGDLDVFIGNKYGEILYYENVDGIYTGNQDAISEITVGTDASYLYFGDTDNDGDNDLAVINPSGALDYYSKSEEGLIKMEGVDNPFRNITDFLVDFDFYDLDGDGDLDILAADQRGRALFIENQLLQSSVHRPLYSDQTMVYPNPASNTVTIDIPWSQGESEIQIFNIHGQLVKKQESHGKELLLNIGDLSNGNYQLRIINGEKIALQNLAILK